MKQLIVLISLLFSLNLAFSQTLKLSRIFASEPQNMMASRIPPLLLEAYRQGDIVAYYPENLKVRIPYAQFLKHYGESAKAQKVIGQNPSWFCEQNTSPKLGNWRLDCLSKQFELGERFGQNKVTMENEFKQEFIRLVHSNECDPRGFETYGPVFLVSDIEKLKGKQYRLVNQKNNAVTYSIIDVMRLRLFNAVERIEK
jgi:hypothetical protein